MAEMYCIRCKSKKLVQEELDYDKHGRPIFRGKCPDCGGKMQIFVSRKEVNSLVKNRYTEMSGEEYDRAQGGEDNDSD